MRRMLLVLGVGVVLGIPATTHAQTVGQDSAVGQGSTGLFEPPYVFDFRATSGPAGENPSGYVTLDFGIFHVEGPVTCLAVSGNTAVVGYRFDPSRSNFEAPGGVMQVVDRPGFWPEGGDQWVGNAVGDPTSCARRFGEDDYYPVFRGDIVVHDAPPLPTTVEQCKGTGYKAFGFRNQGQCVAFVQRGAKP